MGIGATAFNQTFASQLLDLERRSLLADVVDGVYVNRMIGIGFRLPPGWIVRSLQEVASTAEGRLVSCDDDELNDAVRSLTDEFLPIVVASAPPLDDPIARIGPHELSPVAVLQFEHHVAPEDVATFDLEAHVWEDLDNMASAIADFEIIAEPTRVTMSASDTVVYGSEYTVLHADAVEGVPARDFAVYFRQQRTVFALRFSDYPRRDGRLSFDFSECVSSVVFR